MAKRFTDTNKWKDSWYRSLKIKYKLAWSYLLDDCDQAGVWKADFDLLSFMVGDKIKEDEFCIVFGDRLLKVAADKYLIKKFIYFQYGELTSKNTMYSKVLTCLKEVGIDGLHIPHRSPTLSPIDGVKEEEEDKYKVKVKEEEEKEEENFDFELIFNAYPKRKGSTGKVDAIKYLNKIVKCEADFHKMLSAATNYATECRKNGNYGTEYVAMTSTFFGKKEFYKEWIDYSTSNVYSVSDEELLKAGRGY